MTHRAFGLTIGAVALSGAAFFGLLALYDPEPLFFTSYSAAWAVLGGAAFIYALFFHGGEGR